MATPPGHLNFQTLQEFLDCKAPGDFFVALYINTRHGYQDEWMSEVARSLGKKGIRTIGILTPQSIARHKLENTDLMAVIDLRQTKSLRGVDVFVISDIDCNVEFPQDSKVLGCAHALLDPPGREGYQSKLHLLSKMDGYMIPTVLADEARQDMISVWNGSGNHAFYKRKLDRFHIMQVGYPPLALTAGELKKTGIEPDAITYAPTLIEYNPDEGGERLKTYGAGLIKFLLERFPRHKIIFRPYHGDMDNGCIKEIIGKFSCVDRFILDVSPGKIFSFAHSDVMITDLSTIIRAFSLVTLRQGIYFQPWGRFRGPQGPNDKMAYACDYDELYEKIDSCMKNPEVVRQELEDWRDFRYSSWENTFDDMVDLICDFHSGSVHEDWITIRRDASSRMQETREFVGKLSDNTNGYWGALAAVKSRDADFLLLAFTLHMAMKHVPSLAVDTTLNAILGQLDIPARPAASYTDIDRKVVLKLYEVALTDGGDGKDNALVHALLKDFNSFVRRQRHGMP